MFYTNEESFINDLLENIDMIDEFNEDGSGNSSFADLPHDHSSSDESFELDPSSHVVYVQKRPYRKRQPKISTPKVSKRYQPIIIPRILKGDIRRKYAQMYANVMNSYNYDLLMSYFQKFYHPSTSMTKTPAHNMNPITEIHGIELLTYYYLILQQSSPDKIMKVSDIQLKQRSDTDDIDLICNFSATYTQIYDLNPNSITASFKNSQFPLLENSTLRKRKLNEEVNLFVPALDRVMFDPINGAFCQSRFTRLPTPMPHSLNAQMTMRINGMKQIVAILFCPLPSHPSNVSLCQSSDHVVPMPISSH